MRFIWMHLEVGALCGLLCGSPLSCEYEHACIVGVCQAADYTHFMCSLFSPHTEIVSSEAFSLSFFIIMHRRV